MSASKSHHYTIEMNWSGAKQGTTQSYTSYSREFTLKSPGKKDILGSSDPAFRGDPTLYNPEELLLASIASCHMLWYLHLCAVNKIHVISYEDNIKGTMTEDKDGGKQ